MAGAMTLLEMNMAALAVAFGLLSQTSSIAAVHTAMRFAYTFNQAVLFTAAFVEHKALALLLLLLSGLPNCLAAWYRSRSATAAFASWAGQTVEVLAGASLLRSLSPF